MLSVVPLPSADELKYFLEVAHTLNLSRAAERLGITQPALTLAMHRLEETLGQRILIRSKSGVKLSRAGEKLVAQTRLLVHEWEKINTLQTCSFVIQIFYNPKPSWDSCLNLI